MRLGVHSPPRSGLSRGGVFVAVPGPHQAGGGGLVTAGPLVPDRVNTCRVTQGGRTSASVATLCAGWRGSVLTLFRLGTLRRAWHFGLGPADTRLCLLSGSCPEGPCVDEPAALPPRLRSHWSVESLLRQRRFLRRTGFLLLAEKWGGGQWWREVGSGTAGREGGVAGTLIRLPSVPRAVGAQAVRGPAGPAEL